jgi:hypothetical protein
MRTLPTLRCKFADLVISICFDISRWMGTYPELPSYVLETGEDLQDVIDKNPDELLGTKVAEKFNHTKLPYLPKVLSIAKALPLQLHPVRTIVMTSMPLSNDASEQRTGFKTARPKSQPVHRPKPQTRDSTRSRRL